MKMIINVLRAFGFRDIFEATNGADALELFWCKQIDLVITDHFMPLYSGADLCRHIRTSKDSPNPYAPIIAVTPGTTRMVVEELRDAGVNEIVAKPFTPKDLLQKINATVLRPRRFIKTDSYIGPDRRRHASAAYTGPERRKSQPSESGPPDGIERRRRDAPDGVDYRDGDNPAAEAGPPAAPRVEPTTTDAVT